MEKWCPKSIYLFLFVFFLQPFFFSQDLFEISLLGNYYYQLSFEYAIQNELDFPNAIYLNAIDKNGLIRTG